MNSRLRPSDYRDPVTGLPSLASLDHASASAVILGYLVRIVGAYDQYPFWTSVAGEDPASGQLVWARFEATEPTQFAMAGVQVTLHDGPPEAPGSRQLPGGGFAPEGISVFGRLTRVPERAVDVAENLLALALREAP